MCDEQLGEVMALVIRVVNFLVAPALNDRQFKTLLDEVGNNYPGLLFAQQCALVVKRERNPNVEHPELTNTDRLLKFHHLLDMTEHLNQIYVKMQGVWKYSRNPSTSSVCSGKLEFSHHSCLLHFEKLGELKDACTASDPAQHLDLQQLADFTSNLPQSFKSPLWRIL